MGTGRGGATRTCTACGAVWGARSARYCGRCGASLGGRSGDALAGCAGRRDLAADRRGRRLARLLGPVVGAAVLGGLAVAATVASGLPFGEDHPPAASSDTVELPPPDDTDVASSSASSSDVAPPERAGVTGPAFADLRCDPDPCVRWRRDLPRGEVRLLGGVLLHAAVEPVRTDRATGERRPPTHEVAVTALGTADGEVRWTQRLAWPSPQLIDGVAVEVVDDELMLIGGPGELHALTAGDGERRWSAVGDVQMVAARSLGGGAVAVWGEGFADDGSAARAPVLVVRDRDSGEVRWQRAGLELVAWTHDRIVGLDVTVGTRELVAYDRDGAERWRRSPVGTEERLVAGDRVLAVVSPAGTEVVDLADGDVLSRIAASVARGDVVTFVGDTLTLARRRAAGDGGVVLVDPVTGAASTEITPVASTIGTRLHALRTDVPWEPPPTDLLVTMRQEQLRLDIRAFGANGEQRWRRQRLVDDPTCCWQLGEPGVGGTLGLIPPRAVRADIELLSAWDGSSRGRIPAPSVGSDELRRWNAGLIEVVLPRPTGPRIVVHGVRGAVRIDGHAELIAARPIPVVRTADGLVGLDPEVFVAP